MATNEQRMEAQARMEAAQAALIEYADGADDDPELHRRLSEELREATEEFLRALRTPN